MEKQDWRKWAVYEGLTKTASRTLQKVVGLSSSSWGGTFLASAIVGWVQVIIAGILVKKKGQKLISDPIGLLGSVIFGVFALISTVLGFATFMSGGDIATSTFIVTLSIVPGMLIDIIFFKYKSTIREWIGMIVAIFAGWLILGAPTEGIEMPLWVWLAYGNSLSVAINQGITQGVKKVDTMFKNFWGGMVAAVAGPLILISIGEQNFLLNTKGMERIWIASIGIGFIVIAMWSFNLLSYKTGASIALKKLLMNVAYLITVMVVGILLFKEQPSLLKLSAIPMFCIALILMDTKIWNFITQK